MRLHFQERPWDLYIAMAYTALAAVVLLAFEVGHTLALLLVLFTPGYVLVAALFPRSQGISGVARIALSLGLSLAMVPILGLILSATPFGIRFPSIVASLAVFTLVVGLVAVARRFRVPAKDRVSLSLNLSMPRSNEVSREDKLLAIGLAIAVVVAAYVASTIRPSTTGDQFTEFYLLGPSGTPRDYPERLNASQPGTVLLSLVSHEDSMIDYTIRVDLLGLVVVYSPVAGTNVTIEQNRTTESWINATLAPGENWTQAYTFAIPFAGLWKFEFLLFKDHDWSVDYLRLRLFVTVSP